jgi:hypothetical protein
MPLRVAAVDRELDAPLQLPTGLAVLVWAECERRRKREELMSIVRRSGCAHFKPSVEGNSDLGERACRC